MYNSSGIQSYRETDISSMSSEKVIVLLYEKIATDLESARKALAEDDSVAFVNKINHSNRIIAELRAALDHELGGEIAQNLDSLYNFMFGEHLDILLDRKAVHIDNCLKVLTPLLEAWRQIPTGTGEKAAQERLTGRPSVGSGPDTASGNQSEPVGGNAPGSAPEPAPGRTSLLSVSA